MESKFNVDITPKPAEKKADVGLPPPPPPPVMDLPPPPPPPAV